MLFDLLHSRLAPTIRIEADTELFVFTRGDKVFSTEPCVHVFDDAVLAVGIQYEGAEPAEAVHLFRHPMHSRGGTRALEAFLRHGIHVVSARGFWFRAPKLHFVVSANLARFTCGFHESIFRGVAFNCMNRWDSDWVTVTTES